MEISAAQLARLVGGELEGSGDVIITGVAGVDDAREGDVVLAENERFFARALNSDACCILAGNGSSSDLGSKCMIRVADPGEAFVAVLGAFRHAEAQPELGIAPSALVDESAVVGENVAIGPGCCVCADAEIGDGCVLFPNTYIGRGVRVGTGTKMHPGVTIYDRCSVGRDVILHAGVVIGADGFGYKPSAIGLTKLPHVGTVKIGDNVEIGANSAVDRAKFGATIIGNGTKIDNLVHIAHNVRIGSNCVVVALSGVAGSVEIGDGVTLAAQTGIKDHVRIEDGSVVAARSGVIGNVSKGSVVSGFPARDHRLEMRAQATLLRLPEILERVRALESELRKLRAEGED